MTSAITNKAALLSAAANLVQLGWHLFMCGPDKKPRQQGGFKNASSDIARLDKALTRHPDGMLAVRTGAESGLVVIDIDVDETKGVDGRPWIEEARAKGLPLGPMSMTPRDGLHLYFSHPGERIPCSAGRIASGVDVRGDDGYIIVPPSCSPVGQYSWQTSPVYVPPPPLPDWLITILKPQPAASVEEPNTPLNGGDLEEVASDLSECLTRIREAASGSRNDTLNRKGFIVGKMVGAGAIAHDDALDQVIRAAMAAGLEEAEARKTAIGAIRAGMKRPWSPRRSAPDLSRINRDHFYALDGRTGFVFKEERDPLTERLVLQHISPGAFREAFGNRWLIVQGSTKPRQAPLGDAWLKWPGRRQYDRVIFAPGKNLPVSTYNLWQGMAVEPAPGNCTKFLALLHDVICGGDQGLYEYLIGWIARAVQRPWDPGEVAVVLRGEKGTGKTFFADHVGELFGEHYVQLASSHHLVGNFNAHLESAILVFADEAFWAGDKQGEGVLKTLITGRSIRVERKGIDSKQVANHVHLIMASNSDWVVPASADERRYLVLDVSDAHRQDHAYFAQIEAEWQAGGREALLDLLTKYDLLGFNVRSVPATEALASQKLLSLPPIDRWYLDALREGGIGGYSWREWVSFEEIRKGYTDWCSQEGARVGSKETLGMRLKVLMPPATEGRSRRCQRTVEKTDRRIWGYEFPPLDECRNYFSRKFGIEFEWVTSDTGTTPGPEY
ncbi:hypothetical protein WV31_12655 [Magnetospirillum sp. ME-1]|uniref:bifunctional DNA primase/polymerase n=1 Tax=Magnetospirillum sp. ME-1 TaxID=1639348 RepID=UPI000A17AA88|nr:bifunctional DNA primase/polymerase [Magnetospirillum sp. ME-1]ARJ66457.1 hypothetical protein WV31_12655 [Magnetospirillum sp. ME-1]